MEKHTWYAKLHPNMLEEYKRRHDEIWPEMVEVLKSAGIKNYTIWNYGDMLFGYYECEFGYEYAKKVQAESEVVKRWDVSMAPIMTFPKDEKTNEPFDFDCVFVLD